MNEIKQLDKNLLPNYYKIIIQSKINFVKKIDL